MRIDLLVKYFESWAPKEIAWENDNIGLQVGSLETEISNIMLALELDEKVLKQAVKKNCNLIITHHPFIFSPIKKLDLANNKKSEIIAKLITEKITLYSAHTNLDYTKNGVSFELAKRLKLQDIDFLENQKSNQIKLVVYVPENSAERVANAIFDAGGGKIGEYSQCSTRSQVTGTFKGSANSNPKIGTRNLLEQVSEIRLEIIVNSWNLNSIINELKKVHPYEEPAFDIFPIQNNNLNYGAGAIGNLGKALTANDFLAHVSKSLKTDFLKFTQGTGRRIKRVAVCGGTCSDMYNVAIASKADAFITADIKYHTFQDAEKQILLIDAGHFETEIPIMDKLKEYFDNLIKSNKESIKVFKYTGSTNPVKFYNKKGVING